MRQRQQISPLLSVAALVSAAMPASASASEPAAPPKQESSIPWWGGPRRLPSIANVPRYNQRKARKLARQTGAHPANSKRK